MKIKIIVQPYILLVAFIFYFFSMVNKSIYDVLAPYTDYVIYISVLLCLLSSQYISKSDIKNHLKYFFVFLIYGFISLLKTHGGLGSLLGFVFVPLYLCALEKLHMSHKSKRSYIIVFSFFIIILSVFARHIASNYSWTLNNYISPNTYGLTCSFCYIYVYILLQDSLFKYKKLYLGVLFLLTIYSTYMLDTRMALYTTVLFYLMNQFVPQRFYKKKAMLLIIKVLIVAGFVFTFVYVSMYAAGFNLNIPFTDKSLYTGRERLWTMFFTYMGTDPINWLIGIGSKVPIYIDTGRSTSQHLHNNVLALITIFGLIGTFMTYGYLLKNIKRISAKYLEYDKNLIVCLTAFMCFLFEGFTENSMVGVSLFPLLCIGIALDRKSNYERRKEL